MKFSGSQAISLFAFYGSCFQTCSACVAQDFEDGIWSYMVQNPHFFATTTSGCEDELRVGLSYQYDGFC